MSNKRITQLDHVSMPLRANDEFVVVQNGETKKIKATNIPAFQENQEILYKFNVVADNEDIRKFVNNEYDRNAAGALYECRTGAHIKVELNQVLIFNYLTQLWEPFSPMDSAYLSLDQLIPIANRQPTFSNIRSEMGLSNKSGIFIYNPWLTNLMYLGTDGKIITVGYRQTSGTITSSSTYHVRFAQDNGYDFSTIMYGKIMCGGSKPTIRPYDGDGDYNYGISSNQIDPHMIQTNSTVRSATMMIPECVISDISNLPNEVYVRFELYRVNYRNCTLLNAQDVALDPSLVRTFFNAGIGGYNNEPMQTVTLNELNVNVPAGALLGVVVRLHGANANLDSHKRYVEKILHSQIVLNLEAE